MISTRAARSVVVVTTRSSAFAADAAKAAREEFSALTGADREGVAVLDIYSEPVELKEVGDENEV